MNYIHFILLICTEKILELTAPIFKTLNIGRHDWKGGHCLVAHTWYNIYLPSCLRCKKCGMVKYPYTKKCKQNDDNEGVVKIKKGEFTFVIPLDKLPQ